jgi:Na+/proline symporter
MVLYASYYGCDQSEAQRSLSAKSLPELKKMILTAGLLRFPITCIYCAAGLTIGTFALTTPEFLLQIPDDRPDWMMPIFIVNYLPSGVIGLLLVAIMAAAMSSLSSAINSLSVVTVEDYCRYSGKSLTDKQFLWAGKVSGFFWGIVTLLLSFFAGDIAPTVIEAINKIGSMFYGPVLATFLIAISGVGIQARFMNVGLLSGVILNGIFWLFIPDVFWFWWNLFGFAMTLNTAFVLSKLLQKEDEPNRTSETPVSILSTKDYVVMIGWFGVILLVCVSL